MTTALTTMHATFPVGISLRYRSSTNNEDLPGFNGAGLYDSKTQHPEETEEDGIAKSLKQVYASLWNFRAFIERDFHRIDHLEAAMGVLVHPNYSDELVNGVAVSFDPAYSTDGSYYVNSQIGEDLVTNPDAHSVPEEILLNSYGTHTVVAISNQVLQGQLLMSNDQLDQLRDHLTVIHDHFAVLYNPGPDEPFAMEIEFKITSDNILAIKQARPWIFSDGALGSGGFAVGRGNALTASFDNPPATHDGNAFSVRFRFSDNLLTSYKEFRDHAVAVTGGALTHARRLDGRSDRWEIDVTPDSYADVRLVLAANRRCTVPGAICTSNGRRLSSPLEHTVEGPPPSPGSGGGGRERRGRAELGRSGERRRGGDHGLRVPDRQEEPLDLHRLHRHDPYGHRARQRYGLRLRGAGGQQNRQELFFQPGRGHAGSAGSVYPGLCAFRQWHVHHLRSGVGERGPPAGPPRYLFLRHRGRSDCRRIGTGGDGRSGDPRGRRADGPNGDGTPGPTHDFNARARRAGVRIGEGPLRRSRRRRRALWRPRDRGGRGRSQPTRPGCPVPARRQEGGIRSG